MLDSKNKEHDFIDLTIYKGQTQVYLCDDCGVHLLPFPQYQMINPHAKGPIFICPLCHMIVDVSLGAPQHADDIKPIDVATPSFEIVPEEKGDKRLFIKEEDHDPEPQEEEILRAQGATIISKKVDAKRD